jgi:phosphatidylserine decarboxylase
MRIDPAGWPFVLTALVLAGAALALGGVAFALVPGVLAVFFLFFFRDPERSAVHPTGTVVAPADGRLMWAGPSTSQGFPPDRWKQITIFLSPADVHVNRMPLAGRVVDVTYHPGRFLPAYRRDSGDLNEYTEVTLDHQGITVVVRQVVGVLARRIVCRVKPGDVVGAGDRFGVMKFGSRMDVFLPASAEILVTEGQRVLGGVTAVARLVPEGKKADA